MKIRPAETSDIRTLSRLNAYVQQMHAKAHPDLFKMAESDDFAVPFFTAMLDDPDVIIYIAEDDHPLGYIVLRVVRKEENPFMHPWHILNIDQIGVQPEYQGKGVGKALMAQAEKLAEQEGLDTIGLDSWDFNTEAHDFFRSQGYEMFNLRMWKKIE